MSGLLSRAALVLAPALAAFACVITASGFLLAAFYLYLLALSAPPPLAALIVGLALLALAVLVILAARVAMGYWQRRSGRAVAARDGMSSMASELGTRAAREAAAAAESHPYYTFCAAFLAGLTLGGSADLRSFVESALRASERRSGVTRS